MQTQITQGYLTDHLGSIRTTIDQFGNVTGYDDYYPFGLPMPGRSSNLGNPNDLNKFTGHERDNEGGLMIDYMLARNYDPEIGRFMSVDPLYHKYPTLSPLAHVANNPINAIDPDGKEIVIIDGDVTYTFLEDGFYDTDGNLYNGDNNNIHEMSKAIINLLEMGGESSKLIKDLTEEGAKTHTLMIGDINTVKTSTKPERFAADLDGTPSNTNVFISQKTIDGYDTIENGSLFNPLEAALGHELSHSRDYQTQGFFKDNITNVGHHKSPTEINAVRVENFVRRKLDLNIRKTYGGKRINF